MVSKLNIYTVNLKHFGRIRYPLNQYIFNLKFNQSLNSCKLDTFPGTWGCPRHVRFACHTSSMHIQSTKAKSKHQKQQYLFLISSKFVMVSKFNIYTVHLKCFDSIRYHLNQYKTLTKNFNQGLNSGELVWKMAKSKHQKQH